MSLRELDPHRPHLPLERLRETQCLLICTALSGAVESNWLGSLRYYLSDNSFYSLRLSAGRQSLHLSIAVLEATDLEQLPRIPPTDLLLSLFRKIDRVIPRTSILKRLERIIDTEEDSGSSDLLNAVLQRGSREMATGGDPDVLGKVLSDGLLARLLEAQRFLDILKPVVDPPEIEGNVLAQVTDNDLELGEAVEEAVGHHSEEVQTDALGEAEGRADQPFSVCPQLVVDAAGGVSGVKVEGYVEFLDCGPEDVPICVVVEDHFFAIGTGSLSVIDERTQESKLGDAASEFVCCLFGIVHRQSSRQVCVSKSISDSQIVRSTYAKPPNRSGYSLIEPAR
jgi:hypothetical protein